MQPIMRAAALLLILLTPLLGGCFAVIAGGAVAGADAAHDRRSFNTVVTDRNIQLSAYDTLNKDKELALKNNVSIIVYNKTMLLIGEVRTPELKERAERTVNIFSHVKNIVNELEVREPEGFWARRNDGLITAHAKTALLDIVDLPNFDPTRVNISTAHHVVYLMGLVSHEEAERVVEITRNVNGVERVVKLFEYTD